MAISINPVLPVLAAQEAGSVAPELVLQPGSVVNAQVLKVLSADLVRIAIAEPLDRRGLGNSVAAGPEPAACGHRRPRMASASPWSGRAAMPPVIRRRRHACRPMRWPMRPSIGRPSCQPKNVLTPLERTAVSAAAQAAVTEQDSLAPLFANLGAAVSSSNLPPKLQAAIAQVLAQQTSLDQNLDGGDIKTAFQKSGIFLEASLAAGSVPPSGVPDLKAALIVLRQTLQSALGINATAATPATPAGGTASRAATGRRREPCAVFVSRSRCPGNPAAAGAVAGRRKPRAGRPGRPQSAGGGARRRTFGRCDLEPAAGSAAGAWQPGARSRHAERRSRRGRDLSHQHAAAADPRRASGRPAHRTAHHRAACAARGNRASSAR